MVLVVFGSLSVLAVAVVVLARTVFEQAAKISELALRKQFYLFDVAKERGVHGVYPMEPSIPEREPEIEPPVLMDMDAFGPDAMDVGART